MKDEPLVTMKTGEEIIQDCKREILKLEIESENILREANEKLRQIGFKIAKLKKTMETAKEMDKPFAHLLKEAGE